MTNTCYEDRSAVSVHWEDLRCRVEMMPDVDSRYYDEPPHVPPADAVLIEVSFQVWEVRWWQKDYLWFSGCIGRGGHAFIYFDDERRAPIHFSDLDQVTEMAAVMQRLYTLAADTLSQFAEGIFGYEKRVQQAIHEKRLNSMYQSVVHRGCGGELQLSMRHEGSAVVCLCRTCSQTWDIPEAPYATRPVHT